MKNALNEGIFKIIINNYLASSVAGATSTVSVVSSATTSGTIVSVVATSGVISSVVIIFSGVNE